MSPRKFYRNIVSYQLSQQNEQLCLNNLSNKRTLKLKSVDTFWRPSSDCLCRQRSRNCVMTQKCGNCAVFVVDNKLKIGKCVNWKCLKRIRRTDKQLLLPRVYILALFPPPPLGGGLYKPGWICERWYILVTEKKTEYYSLRSPQNTNCGSVLKICIIKSETEGWDRLSSKK